MSPEPANPFSLLQQQMRDALDAQLAALAQHHEAAVDEARQQITAEVEQAALDKIEAVRAELERRVAAETAARADAERPLVAETTRLRVEAEQQAAESTARVREELEHALAAERQHADQLVTAERQQFEIQLESERRRLQAEAEQQAAESTARVREELEHALAAERQRADQVVAAEREQFEIQLESERRRLQAEAQQQAAESTARLREELEHALAAERQRADRMVTAEREQFETQLESERRRLQAETQQQATSASALTDARVAERQAGLAGFEHLLDGIRALDAAHSLTDALAALLTHAARASQRAALFLVSGDRLKSWRTDGFPELDAHPFESAITGSGLLATAIQTGDPVASGEGQPAPTFAAVPDDRIGLAVPITVGGRSVAVVYADNVGDRVEVPAAWPEVVETLACHASTVLALLTASRTLHALGRGDALAAVTNGSGDDEQGARRYARLLVSEIKLYNEGAVRLGRENRDLLARLATEIDRARRMYEERVSPAVAARGLYFRQELVQTLAGGDPGLLGNS
jgi:chemotaxis protein histidine kinase CheA